MTETTYVTIPAFADAVGFSASTVRSWVRDGVIPERFCFRVNRSTRIDLTAAREYLVSQRPSSVNTQPPSGDTHE